MSASWILCEHFLEVFEQPAHLNFLWTKGYCLYLSSDFGTKDLSVEYFGSLFLLDLGRLILWSIAAGEYFVISHSVMFSSLILEAFNLAYH